MLSHPYPISTYRNNQNGTIQAIKNFEGSSITSIYEYDSEGKVSKKSSYFGHNQQEFTSMEKYYWEENQIVKVERFNGNEELQYEYFYQYDDKINYSKRMLRNLNNPIYWGENNVIEMKFNDHLGDIDLPCNPCISEYTYNSVDLPISIISNEGINMTLNYDFLLREE